MSIDNLRVLIVAEHASMAFGGEASLPLYYFRQYRKRGVETWMVVHERTREELRELLGGRGVGVAGGGGGGDGEFARVHFVGDTLLHKVLWRIGQWLPAKIDEQTLGLLRHLRTQLGQRRIAQRLIREHHIDVVHEAMPISPKEPSMMVHLGAAVVIGPMCGGMDYPPAFQYMQSRWARMVERLGRRYSHLVHRLARGKLSADALVVANRQTRDALPRGVRGKIYEVVESGVDLAIWKARERDEGGRMRDERGSGEVRFVFSGRLVDWKGVDLLLEAFGVAHPSSFSCVLEIIGDGPLREALHARARELGLAGCVEFTGWVSRPDSAARIARADVLVLPSMRECGGTVVLEAMAMGLPVIATNWGGPARYLDDSCGIRVNPDSREGFIGGLSEAMVRLAESPELRQRMSEAARARARSQYFDWDSKTERMLQIFRETVRAYKRGIVASDEELEEMGLDLQG